MRLAGISYPFPWTVDTERGLALGDSFAEALQVAAEHAFWAVLERELARCPALQGRPIETVNFGVSGYATAQALITLRRKVWRYQPDIVILAFFAGNDVEDNAPRLSGYDRRPYYRIDGDNLVLDGSFSRNLRFRRLGVIWTTLIDLTIDRSRLIQFLNEAGRKLRTSGPQFVSAAVADAQDSARMSTPADAGKEAGLSDFVFRPPEGHAWRQAWAITEALLLMMRGEVQVGGAEFWLATLSAGWQVHPDPALRTAAMQRLGIDTAFYPERRLERFAQEHGIDILTLAEPLQSYAERGAASMKFRAATGVTIRRSWYHSWHPGGTLWEIPVKIVRWP